MRSVALILVLAGVVLLAAGCAGAGAGCRVPVAPPAGGLLTVYKAPLTTDFRGQTMSSRSGSASTLFLRDPFITGLSVAWADASTTAAARNGGLSHVHYADYEMVRVLSVFGKFTVTAYGQ